MSAVFGYSNRRPAPTTPTDNLIELRSRSAIKIDALLGATGSDNGDVQAVVTHTDARLVLRHRAEIFRVDTTAPATTLWRIRLSAAGCLLSMDRTDGKGEKTKQNFD